MDHTYSLPIVKLLFATARTCAYPGCVTPLVFIDEDRDVRETIAWELEDRDLTIAPG